MTKNVNRKMSEHFLHLDKKMLKHVVLNLCEDQADKLHLMNYRGLKLP